MMCIHEKLNSSVSKKISAQQIWQRLGAMFDLQALVSSHEPTARYTTWIWYWVSG